MMLGHGNIEGKEVMVEERAGKEIVELTNNPAVVDCPNPDMLPACPQLEKLADSDSLFCISSSPINLELIPRDYKEKLPSNTTVCRDYFILVHVATIKHPRNLLATSTETEFHSFCMGGSLKFCRSTEDRERGTHCTVGATISEYMAVKGLWLLMHPRVNVATSLGQSLLYSN
uniref:Uncharacterized protein n=1 Tax=Cucumis sativus TaxID=3659 RepID=A0A0A0LGQ8_CUCSA